MQQPISAENFQTFAEAEAASAAPSQPEQKNYEVIMDIPLGVHIILGSCSMTVSSLMALSRGAIIPLSKRVGEPVDVVANGKKIARGELVNLEDDKGGSHLGVQLIEVVNRKSESSV